MALTGGGAIPAGDTGPASPATGNVNTVHLSFPAAFDATWLDGSAYVTNGTPRDTTGPDAGLSFQGDVTALTPALLAAEQALVHSAHYSPSGQGGDITIEVDDIEPGTYRVDVYCAQYNSPPVLARDFSVDFQQGQAGGYVDLSSTNAAAVVSRQVTIADGGGGSGTLRVDLIAINDLSTICALRMIPASANLAPDKPTVTATALNFHKIQLSFTASSDDVGVVERRLYRDSTLIATLPSNQILYDDTDLALDTLYSYELEDVDAEPLATISDPSSARTLATIRIDSGQSQDYLSQSGVLWVADTAIADAILQGAVTNAPIAGTPDPLLYQSVSEEISVGAGFSYQFPLDAGRHRARLHFAEWNGGVVAGDRLMAIDLDGSIVESAFDVFDEAGVDRAIIKDYLFTSDGTFDLELIGTGQSAFLSALEVLPTAADAGTPTLVTKDHQSFEVAGPQTSNAAYHLWYVDGAASGSTGLNPSLILTGLQPSTAYDVQLQAIDAHDLPTALSITLVVTTDAAPAAPEVDVEHAVLVDASPRLRLLPWRADPETVGAQSMIKLYSYAGRDNLERFSLAESVEGQAPAAVDTSAFTRVVLNLFKSGSTTPDFTIDSNTAPAVFDLTSSEGIGVEFGQVSPAIDADSYTGIVVVYDATHTNGRRVFEQFGLTHAAF